MLKDVVIRCLAEVGQEYTVQQGEIGPALTRGKKLVVQMVETFGEKWCRPC